MAAEFKDAPDVRRVGDRLRLVRFADPAGPNGDLAREDVCVVYLFRDDVPNSGGAEVWGTAKVITGRDWFLAQAHLRELGLELPVPDPGAAFRIEISQPIWKHLTDTQKEALVYHELCHCVAVKIPGKPVALSSVAHDLEVFGREYDHYGPWRRNLQTFAQLVGRSPHQLVLPGDADDGLQAHYEWEQEITDFLHGNDMARGFRAVLVRDETPGDALDAARTFADDIRGSGLSSVTLSGAGRSVTIQGGERAA